MAKTKALFQTIAAQQRAQSFNDVAVGRFRAQFPEKEAANQYMEQQRNRNMMIEEVLVRIKE